MKNIIAIATVIISISIGGFTTLQANCQPVSRVGCSIEENHSAQREQFILRQQGFATQEDKEAFQERELERSKRYYQSAIVIISDN